MVYARGLVAFALAVSGTSMVLAEEGADFLEHDAEGFLKQPACAFHQTAKKTLEIMSKETPTGIRASNDQWEMEIYASEERGTWTLVGKSKDPKAKKFQLCYIAQSLSGQPYTDAPWYKKYFLTPGS